MQSTTLDIVHRVLKSDATIPPPELMRTLAALRKGFAASKPETPTERVKRLIRRAEAARRMSCSVRTIDNLAAAGVLTKRTLPGRVRGSGFLEEDLEAVMAARATVVSPTDKAAGLAGDPQTSSQN
jgi:hypothetical protein